MIVIIISLFCPTAVVNKVGLIGTDCATVKIACGPTVQLSTRIM